LIERRLLRAGGAVLLAAALFVLAAHAAPAAAAETPAVSSSEQAAVQRGTPSGSAALLASAAYPGLGQLLNGAEPKSAVVSAVEALLIAGLIVEDRRTRNSLRLYQETHEDSYYDDYSQHYDRRQTLIWWVALAALYSLTDAYVDAHLVDFKSPPVVVPEGTFSSAGREAGGLRVGLAFRF
jgi:hypothetical protein